MAFRFGGLRKTTGLKITKARHLVPKQTATATQKTRRTCRMNSAVMREMPMLTVVVVVLHVDAGMGIHTDNSAHVVLPPSLESNQHFHLIARPIL